MSSIFKAFTPEEFRPNSTILPTAIRVVGATKTFKGHRALRSVSFAIQPGERVALVGASGSGKSTLLRSLNGLHRLDMGQIEILNRPLQNDGQLQPQIRPLRHQVGFIFQQFNLVQRLTVLENVLVGGLAQVPPWRSLLRYFTRAEKRQALLALEQVGILAQAHQRAGTLSGGQQQRVAIARCLMQGAKIILADEPIASLDPESAHTVMELLTRLNEQGITIVAALHQVQVVRRYFGRAIALRQGEICFDGPTAALDGERLKAIYGAAAAELVLRGHGEAGVEMG
ncbi:MAG: phosphonate ABC transporter ATP-binding protein [Cyanobacteria bacterium P01_G01_bin.54]